MLSHTFTTLSSSQLTNPSTLFKFKQLPWITTTMIITILKQQTQLPKHTLSSLVSASMKMKPCMIFKTQQQQQPKQLLLPPQLHHQDHRTPLVSTKLSHLPPVKENTSANIVAESLQIHKPLADTKTLTKKNVNNSNVLSYKLTETPPCLSFETLSSPPLLLHNTC